MLSQTANKRLSRHAASARYRVLRCKACSWSHYVSEVAFNSVLEGFVCERCGGEMFPHPWYVFSKLSLKEAKLAIERENNRDVLPQPSPDLFAFWYCHSHLDNGKDAVECRTFDLLRSEVINPELPRKCSCGKPIRIDELTFSRRGSWLYRVLIKLHNKSVPEVQA